MRRTAGRRLFVLIAALSLLAVSPPAGAHPEGDHDDTPGEPGSYTSRESTANMHAQGHSEHPAQFFGVPSAERTVSSDIAFWGEYAIHGNYDGFRIVDISAPGNPKLVSHPKCNGDQGDIVVWDDIVVRSWNSPAPAGRFCDGEPVPVGFEGVHVFDISDPADPDLIGAVEFSQAGAAQRGTADGCGSHTQTAVPDLANNRLVIYSNNSSGGGRAVCDTMNIIEVPLDAPSAASHIGYAPLTGGSRGSNNGCHDAGAILGDVNLLACASGHAANVFSIGAPRGGTLENPRFLYAIEESDGQGNAVGDGGRWHSAAFTWDGEVLALGWEPGGGAQARCQESNPDIDKSMFFYDAGTGAKLGQWTLPRAQSETENCTIHNYNMVPLRNGKYVAVGGHYQAGTWAVDFSDPSNPRTIGFSDPSPIEPSNLGGAWSTYWYNNFIYESEIQTGLNVFRLSSPATGGAIKLPHLNPQTQDFSLN
ncbi:LVIVD repeat-containing protein [Amycolatopsis palatopharyngis]|uniref:LVIVD repeat-containing protein n=1 Tax=Amycolatopsis palatopharyngis TaxID=187982 RepID=UPI000E27ED76|nr:hypothetical protein [Amycolatopsis palatopharyngis]